MTSTLERPATESPGGMLRGAARGGIANLAGTVCTGLAGVGVTWLAARALDPHAAGAFFAATATFGLGVTVAKRGVQTSLVYWPARMRAVGDLSRFGECLRVAMLPVAVAAVCLAAGLWFAADLLPGRPDLARALALFLPAAAFTDVLPGRAAGTGLVPRRVGAARQPDRVRPGRGDDRLGEDARAQDGDRQHVPPFDEDFNTDSDRRFAARGSTMMQSWAGGDNRLITMGRYDDLIRQRARELKAFGHPVLLRYRWEMDRPNLRAQMWSGADYIAAWKYVRNIFTQERATNASWVWYPTAEGFQNGTAASFYPGDDQVDWTCVDVYAGTKYGTIGAFMRPFLEFCAQHPSKPVMIGEFGIARSRGSAQRAAWLQDASATFKANPQIRAVLYFESDPTENKGPTNQYMVSDDPDVLSAFRSSLAQDAYYKPMTASRP
ncbi:glycoside hydrolase family 26 protein [Dactylosporangium sp. McL0621]|uniref:glycoside hydrolase family 26 protein n=1 Tax=Dactylosporangium sp. McL0621 TaxID=3415678 RepID=UPI003CFA73CE